MLEHLNKVMSSRFSILFF